MDQKRSIRLITLSSILEVDKTCRSAGYATLPFPIALIEGCAVYHDNECVIYARSPCNGQDTSAYRILGHEVMHCFAGDWHQDRQEVKFDAVKSPLSCIPESE